MGEENGRESTINEMLQKRETVKPRHRKPDPHVCALTMHVASHRYSPTRASSLGSPHTGSHSLCLPSMLYHEHGRLLRHSRHARCDSKNSTASDTTLTDL